MEKREFTEGEQLGFEIAKEIYSRIEAKAIEKKDAQFHVQALTVILQMMCSYLGTVFTKHQVLQQCKKSIFMIDDFIDELGKTSNKN